MRERIDVYGIDAPDLERVARIIEKKFNIEFELENDSEMGGVYYEYDPNPDRDGDQFWSLYRTDDDDIDEDEEGIEEPPIRLRIQDAPDMDEVRRKMAEIDEFVVVLESRKVFDKDQLIYSYAETLAKDEDG